MPASSSVVVVVSVKNIRIQRDNGQSKTAFVTFKDPKALEIALLLSKCQRSQKFASEVGLPVLKNVVLLKTRGFCLCLEVLRGSLDAVYDVSIAYKHQLPTFLDNVFGTDPSEVHIHVRRIPAKEMPALDSEAATWLMDRFQLKDRLLSDFKAHSHFLNEGIEQELSTLRCLVIEIKEKTLVVNRAEQKEMAGKVNGVMFGVS